MHIITSWITSPQHLIYLTFNLLRIFIEESFFLPTYLFSSSVDLPGFFISDHSITNHMAPHDFYETPDLIYNVFRVVIYLFQFLDSLSN